MGFIQRRRLAKRVKAIRKEAYKLLSADFCSMALIRPEEGGGWNYCLEGALLIAGGWDPADLYNLTVRRPIGTLEAVISNVESDPELLPDGVDMEAVAAAAHAMSHEIETEARWRILAERRLNHDGDENHVPTLHRINDTIGKEVTLEVLRDGLFPADEAIALQADLKLETL